MRPTALASTPWCVQGVHCGKCGDVFLPEVALKPGGGSLSSAEGLKEEVMGTWVCCGCGRCVAMAGVEGQAWGAPGMVCERRPTQPCLPSTAATPLIPVCPVAPRAHPEHLLPQPVHTPTALLPGTLSAPPPIPSPMPRCPRPPFLQCSTAPGHISEGQPGEGTGCGDLSIRALGGLEGIRMHAKAGQASPAVIAGMLEEHLKFCGGERDE